MGLSDVTKWKEIIKKVFGVKMMTKSEADVMARDAQVVMLDIMIPFHNICCSNQVKDWNSLYNALSKFIDGFLSRFPNATKFIIYMDEHGKSPQSKAATQESRGTGLTKEELKRLGVYAYLCGPRCDGDESVYDFIKENAMEEEALKKSSNNFEDSLLKKKMDKLNGCKNAPTDNKRKRSVASMGGFKSKIDQLTSFQVFLRKYARTKTLRGDMNRFMLLCCADIAMAMKRQFRLRPEQEVIIDGGICKAPPSTFDWRYEGAYPPSTSDMTDFMNENIMRMRRGYKNDLGGDDDDDDDDEDQIIMNSATKIEEDYANMMKDELKKLQTISSSRDFRKIIIGDINNETPIDVPSWSIQDYKSGDIDSYKSMSISIANNGIGEADIKILKDVEHNNHKYNWVVVDDSDLIPILLLSVRSLIDKDTCEFGHDTRLILDMDRNQSVNNNGLYNQQSSSVIDIIDLWKGILEYFNQNFPNVAFPIETFCMILILNGTDHFSGFPWLSPNALWTKAFSTGGHYIMERAITTDKKFGIPTIESPRIINFDEDAIMKFIRYAYATWMDKETEKKIKNVVSRNRGNAIAVLDDSHPFLYPSYKSIDDWIKIKMAKSKKEIAPFNEDTLRASVRRAIWNLNYWINGHTALCPDPLSKDGDGTSLYGWVTMIRDNEVKEQINTIDDGKYQQDRSINKDNTVAMESGDNKDQRKRKRQKINHDYDDDHQHHHHSDKDSDHKIDGKMRLNRQQDHKTSRGMHNKNKQAIPALSSLLKDKNNSSINYITKEAIKVYMVECNDDTINHHFF